MCIQHRQPLWSHSFWRTFFCAIDGCLSIEYQQQWQYRSQTICRQLSINMKLDWEKGSPRRVISYLLPLVYLWGLVCKKLVSWAGTINCIPQYMLGVITCLCTLIPASGTHSLTCSCVLPGTVLRWRHNGHHGVSNHQPHHCLLNRLFGCRSKKTSKLRVYGLCAGNSPGTGEFPAQMASNAENVSIWWRHHGVSLCRETWIIQFGWSIFIYFGLCTNHNITQKTMGYDFLSMFK